MDFITNNPVVTGIAVLVLAFLLIAWAFAKNYVKVPPDKVAVFTGRGLTTTVRKGARFRMPLIEQVDHMSIEPFNIEVEVSNVYSKDVVPVSVAGVSVITFGITDEALATSTARFLHTDRERLRSMITEILAGNMRNIVSQMTVEELNGNRDEFARRVKEEATLSYDPIGMQLDVFNIKNLTDNNGYLDALGQTRTAEVKRDAAIGRAHAERDSMIKAATATQEGKQAQAHAAILIAQAERARDLELASISSEVEAAKARAAQSGPLAQAESQRAVVLAGVATKRAETEALIGVEEQRAKQKERAVQADTIIPAEAEKAASIARAEGKREADIAAATAAARQRELQGVADANARKLLANARQAEMTAEAEGNKALKLAEADGNKALRLAEAEGTKALRLAEAEGQEKLAAALTSYTEEAARLNMLPQLIAILPEVMSAIANGVNIDKMVVLDGGGSTGAEGGAINRAIGVTPAVLAKAVESLSTLGVDFSSLLGSVMGSKDGSSTKGPQPAPALPERIDGKPDSANVTN